MDILIINSEGYWINGWAIQESKVEIIANTLEKTGLKISTIEVNSIEQLTQNLNSTSPETLVWVNAYWVNMGGDKVDWLSRYVEDKNFPILGQSQKTLNNLLKKDVCQSKMKEAHIPVPSFVIIEKEQASEASKIIFESNIEFPLVAKPTNESRSSGICIVYNIKEAMEMVNTIFEKYPEGNIIIEEFLPNDDVTCGYIQLGDEYILLPSNNVVKGMNCKEEIYSEKHYLLSSTEIDQVCVSDQTIIDQFKKYIPEIVNLFDIQSITRVDARMNKENQLCYFDVNGMPGLNFPTSAIIKQCNSHFSKYDPDYVFECLINTLVLDKLMKYKRSIPHIIQENNLFNLESETAIKGIKQMVKKLPEKQKAKAL